MLAGIIINTISIAVGGILGDLAFGPKGPDVFLLTLKVPSPPAI